MTKRDYNKTIILIIHFIVMNNGFAVARELKNEGYDSKDYIPSSDLETALLQLYIADPVRFFGVLKNIDWNDGHKATNQPEIKEQLMKLVSIQTGTQATAENWWPSLITFLSTSTIK